MEGVTVPRKLPKNCEYRQYPSTFGPFGDVVCDHPDVSYMLHCEDDCKRPYHCPLRGGCVNMHDGDRVMLVIPAVIDDLSNHGTPSKPNMLAWLKLDGGRSLIVVPARYLRPMDEVLE